MRTLFTAGAVVTALIGIWAAGNLIAVAQVESNDNKIAVMDDCLPGDAGYDTLAAARSSRTRETSRRLSFSR